MMTNYHTEKMSYTVSEYQWAKVILSFVYSRTTKMSRHFPTSQFLLIY